MKVRLSQATTSPNGLVFGVQIHGPRDSWVRFGILEVPWESVPPEALVRYTAWLDRDERLPLEDEPLPLDWR